MPAQVLFSSSDYGSKLRGSLQNSSRTSSKLDVNQFERCTYHLVVRPVSWTSHVPTPPQSHPPLSQRPQTHQSGGGPRSRYGTRPLQSPCGWQQHDANGQDGRQAGHLTGGHVHCTAALPARGPSSQKEPVQVYLVPAAGTFYDHEKSDPEQESDHQCGRGETRSALEDVGKFTPHEVGEAEGL
ncbi:hypothetical protein AVEN_59891-1 [Araneus ventricosus]|uniref:Uncharacterized protein n=1 Tax=Araneus ventricosus TaxID=182803 RepID=A0A4Y2EE77_ARAVE|nr:hypothetical protein AVEN_59891-1 [Araneus ventricosus]